jgi:hypothetical protein
MGWARRYMSFFNRSSETNSQWNDEYFIRRKSKIFSQLTLAHTPQREANFPVISLNSRAPDPGDLTGIQSYYAELSDGTRRRCVDNFASLMSPNRSLLDCVCCGVLDFNREVQQQFPVFGNLSMLQLNLTQIQEYLSQITKLWTVIVILQYVHPVYYYLYESFVDTNSALANMCSIFFNRMFWMCFWNINININIIIIIIIIAVII